MLNIRTTLLAFFALVAGLNVQAQTGNSTIFRFLEVTPSARLAALGGNHTGIFNPQADAFYINPAFLQPHHSKEVSATFVNQLYDVRMGLATSAFDLPKIGTIGVGIRYTGYGEMSEFDENGAELGSFSAGDLAIRAGLSTQLSEKLSAGAAADYIYSSYSLYRSSAFALSGGIYFKNPEKKFSMGLAVRNLGDQFSYYNQTREELPFDVSLGFSKKPENFPFQINFTLTRLNDWDLRVFGEDEQPAFLRNLSRHVIIGGEAPLGKALILRLGYNRYLHEQTRTDRAIELAGASIGLGIKVKGLVIDLSRSSYSQTGGLVQLSVRTNL